MMPNFNAVKALAFDYYGTIANKGALSSVVDGHFPGQGDALTKLWFSTCQRYCFQNGMMNRYAPWDELTKAALDYACSDLNIPIPEAVRTELIDADASLPVYAEVHKALPRLAKKFSLYVLSMGSAWMIKRSQQNAGVDGHFTDIITTEQAKIYKPKLEAYELALRETGLEKNQLGFVSGNSFDVIGSKNFGLPTIWVRRHNQALDGLGLEPDLIVDDLLAMADILGASG